MEQRQGEGKQRFLKGGKLGQGVGGLKKSGAGTLLRTMITLIIICINAGCTSSAGDIPLLVSLIFYI